MQPAEQQEVQGLDLLAAEAALVGRLDLVAVPLQLAEAQVVGELLDLL